MPSFNTNKLYKSFSDISVVLYILPWPPCIDDYDERCTYVMQLMHVGPRAHATTYQITKLDPNGHGKEMIIKIYKYNNNYY